MQKKSRPQIFSIGHSNRALEEFVGVLKRYGIEALADIRTYPRSKRNPHFDRESLETGLLSSGIEYAWIRELGGLRKDGYENYMRTDGFQEGFDMLMTVARERRTAFMCSELDWRHCHRSFVSRALHARGWEVVHIYDGNESETHSGLF